MSMINLERAKIFLQVVESGSLTRAATLLDTQQSVISRGMSAFERECRGRLFDRTGRGVVLTELGARILPRVRSLVLQADQLADEMRNTAGMPMGEVRLGLLPSMTRPLVSQLFRLVREKYPGVRLRIAEGSGGQLAEWVAGGQVDIAILFRAAGRDGRDTTALRRVGLYLVGPHGDRLTRSQSVPFVKLHDLPLVLPGARSGLRTILEHLALRKKISLNIAIEADALGVQKDVVTDGGAHTILTAQAIHREVRAGSLQAARITTPTIERTVALATTPQHPMTLAAREVARLMRQLIDTMPVSIEPFRKP